MFIPYCQLHSLIMTKIENNDLQKLLPHKTEDQILHFENKLTKMMLQSREQYLLQFKNTAHLSRIYLINKFNLDCFTDNEIKFGLVCVLREIIQTVQVSPTLRSKILHILRQDMFRKELTKFILHVLKKCNCGEIIIDIVVNCLTYMGLKEYYCIISYMMSNLLLSCRHFEKLNAACDPFAFNFNTEK